MSERIHEWTIDLGPLVLLEVPADEFIGWGYPVHAAVTEDPLQMKVWTLEDSDDHELLPERRVRVVRSHQDLPLVAEHVLSTSSPSGTAFHLIAVDDGTGLGPDGSEVFSTSLTTPDGTLSATIVVEKHAIDDHEYGRILSSAVEHMQFLIATGIKD